MAKIRKVLVATLAGLLTLPLLTSAAEAVEWWIERMSGDVQVHDGTSWTRLTPDRALNSGDSLWTGRNGRILIRNEQGSVLLAPRSLVKIPAQTLPSNFSALFQTHGKVSAEVEKRRTRHFSIQTPYLAVVVKGTEFDVEIDGDETFVSVDRGLVGVVDIESRQTVSVSAGMAVSAATTASGMSFGQSVAASAHNNGKAKGKDG